MPFMKMNRMKNLQIRLVRNVQTNFVLWNLLYTYILSCFHGVLLFYAADSDSSDSDIDEPEPNEDAEKLEKQRDEQRQAQAEKLAEAYTQTAASEAYTDPALQKKSTKALRQHVEKQRQKLKELTGQSETSKSSSSAAASESASASSTDHSQSASARHSKNSCAPTILDPDRALRTSTKRVRKYVESNQKEEEERDAKSVKSTAKQPKQPQLTQEDCLREAAETTIKNLRSLNAMQKMEEEAARKRKSGSSQRKLHGPRVVFHSSRGKGDLLVFTEVDEVPRIINSVCSAPTETPKSYFNPRQSAIYKDPLTGHGYRTKDEFKRLRSKFGKEGVKMMTPEARDRYEMRQNRQKRDHENKLLSKLSSLARQGENMGYVLDTHDRIGQSSR